MKVVLLGAASSVHIMRWANAFAQRNVAVHVVTQHDPVAGYDPRVVMHRLPHFGGLGYLFNKPSLGRLLSSIGPDVVNAHYASGYGTLAYRCDAWPLVLNVWGSDVFEFPDTSPVHHALLRRNLRRADAIVSTSEVMARRTVAICPGLPPITVVPFGVDTDRFTPGHPHHEESVLVIGTVKTLAPKYGIDTLLRAFAILLQRMDRGTPLRLRIVGGGPEENDLRRLISELGIGDVVDLIGSVPHERVPEELRGMDIYVALSRSDSESFGVAIIEASACGLPVVVSDVGGLPEVVEDGVTGSIVPADDPVAAADRLLALCRSAGLRKGMGEAGRKRVETHYDWSACVDRQLMVFQKVLADRRGR